MKLFTKEIKMGLVTVFAIAIIFFGIMFLKNIRLSTTNNLYYIEMSDVNGLATHADVLANGMEVGLVKSMQFNAERQMVIIGVELMEGYTLPVGSSATLVKDMLGAPKVKIMLGTDPKHVLSPGDTIPGTPMVDLMATAGDMIPAVESLIPKLDSILTALNTLAADPSIAQSLHNMEYVTGNLRTTTDRINSLLARDIPATISNVNALTSSIQHTTDQLGEVDFGGLANNANQAIDQLNLFTNRLNDPNSSLGKLTNGDDLYCQLDSTMTNANRLLEDLRLHPKRYVHFSLIGPKEKKK